MGQIPTQLHLCEPLCLDLHPFPFINPQVAAALLGLTGVSHTYTHTRLLCEWDLMLMELPVLYLQSHLCPNRQTHVSNCWHLLLDVPTASTSAVGSELTSPQMWALLSPLCNGITTSTSTWYLLPHSHPISCQVLLSLCLAWFSCRFLNRIEGISPGFL